MNFGYFGAIWRYRHFIFSSVRNEVFGRFARSTIGGLWVILHPLAMALIYILVLSEVLGAKIGGVENKASYAIYLMSGIAAWSFFNEVVNRSLTVFIEYGPTLKRIMFPRIALPFIVWLGAALNHLILLIAIFIIFMFYEHMPTIHWVAIPLGFVIISCFAIGLGILSGIMNVFSRDVGQVMVVLLNLWFWLTPIVYSEEVLPEHLGDLMKYNPVTPLVGFYQDIMLFQRWPDWFSLIYPIAVSLSILLIALFIFRKGSAELVDVL